MRKRAVFVDDHVGLAEMAGDSLGRRMNLDVLPVIATKAAALQLLPTLAPDIVILDHRLADGRGIDLVPALKDRLPDTRWLLYSAYTSAHAIKEAIGCGIDGAVMKGERADVLAQAVQTLLDGNRFFCATIAKKLREASEVKEINASERRILEQVAAGYEPKEIAAVLGLSYKTVLNVLVSIRQKTGVHSMVGLAEFARMSGLAVPA